MEAIGLLAFGFLVFAAVATVVHQLRTGAKPYPRSRTKN